MKAVTYFLDVMGVFFFLYLTFYASYLFLSVSVGAWRLYYQNRMRRIKNELKHQFYFPVSVLVPAYNEEVTILDSVESLMNLDYKLYEIIVVDDGSKDNTSQVLIDHFHMRQVSRPIRRTIPCQPQEAVYEAPGTRVKLTLVRKKNGGKGDALNMGINASQYPYFLCLDADSMLQRDSLERIVQPVMEDDSVVAVGGLIRVAQCVHMVDGVVQDYRLPWNLLTTMQVMEYDRSFLASRILLDAFNGNLIISGAFGLFNKEVVVAAGGYDPKTLGEDMELVVKLHVFCRHNMRKYSIRYEPNAVCWSQAPGSLSDLRKQRRRWHLGLFQSLAKSRVMFCRPRFGLVGSVSYLYYLFYELLSPWIEIIGLFTTLLALFMGLLDLSFAIRFYLFYAFYGAILTMTAFFQRIYTQNQKISGGDIVKACVMCVVENVFFRFVLDFVRATAFIGYKKKKNQWGQIKRRKHSEIR
ncbi:MAG: glycosyltransferase family 2 protein [Oscillibacter sp.]|nr:glycosyltransferase family 2 protein [Oscillibacter sp.]